MKARLISTAMVVALAAPAIAEARPHPDHHARYADRDGARHDRNGHHRGHPHGIPPGQAKKLWRQGQYIPRAYVTEREYYIVEPARYRLRPPPPGYRWVRVDGDVYLAQTETGLIAEVVRSLFR